MRNLVPQKMDLKDPEHYLISFLLIELYHMSYIVLFLLSLSVHFLFSLWLILSTEHFPKACNASVLPQAVSIWWLV